MIFQRLRETLYFFWRHLTQLLVCIAPLLPLLALANYRLLSVYGGDPQKALESADTVVLLPELLAGVFALALTLRYTLAVLAKEPAGLVTVWGQSLRNLPALIVVQILLGLMIGLPALLLLLAGLRPDIVVLLVGLPALYLLGALLPAYVIAVRERQGPLAAMRISWQRFRSVAWTLSACLVLLMMLLLLVQGGLESLIKLLEAAPLAARVAASSFLELIALLFWQMTAILLVRFYEVERIEPPKGGWN